MSKKNDLKGRSVLLFVVLFVLFVLQFLAGCGVRDLATGKVTPPEAVLQGLAIYPPESDCWPLDARVRLKNPNPEPLRILGYDYEFSLEGVDLVQGESASAVTLPAGGETLVEIPVVLRLNAVPKALKVLLLQERLRYELGGGFRLASLLGGLKVPFRFRGEVTREEGLQYLRSFLEHGQ